MLFSQEIELTTSVRSFLFLCHFLTRNWYHSLFLFQTRRWIIFPSVNCVACFVVHHAQGKLLPNWHSYLLIPHTLWCVMKVVAAGLYISQREQTGSIHQEKKMLLSASWLEQVKVTGLPVCLCVAHLTPNILCSSHTEMLLILVRWAAFI